MREARRFLERLLDTAPGDLDALTRLVDLVDDPRSRRAAAERVSNAHEADPQSEAVSALFARLGSGSGEEGRTEEERAERPARRLRRQREGVRQEVGGWRGLRKIGPSVNKDGTR